MQKLTLEEFTDRVNAVDRARRIFIDSGLTDNITHAFTLYQEVLAESERDIMVSSVLAGDRPRLLLDIYERPKCLECGRELLFKPLEGNAEGIRVQLTCAGPECDVAYNSQEDLDWWVRALQEGRETDFTAMVRVSKRDPIPGTKYTWLQDPCPECGGAIYTMDKCCGAPEGLIECSKCDFQQKPSEFYNRG